jgi:ubiquinone/menaquinone biosynthesis C-methylase UbiE
MFADGFSIVSCYLVFKKQTQGMKVTIDNFSEQAGGYARYRPAYPEALYTFILKQVPQRQLAWDCGTGNGQVAARLAASFKQVHATDISEQQLAHAIRQPNIHYHASRAEQSGLADKSVDLITVAQALHWFDFDHFYAETKRVAVPGAIVAAWCYGLLRISPELDEHISVFYHDTLGAYWDKERQYIDQAYETIPFPYDEIKAPTFTMRYTWTLAELEGYFNTWSSVQKYMRTNQHNPVSGLIENLKETWGNTAAPKAIDFDLHLRIGQVR